MWHIIVKIENLLNVQTQLKVGKKPKCVANGDPQDSLGRVISVADIDNMSIT